MKISGVSFSSCVSMLSSEESNENKDESGGVDNGGEKNFDDDKWDRARDIIEKAGRGDLEGWVRDFYDFARDEWEHNHRQDND